MKPTLLLTTALMLASFSTDARAGELGINEIQVIHDALKKAPDATVFVGATRYIMVNDRFEDCTTRKAARREGRFIKRIDPAETGWAVTIMTLDGIRLLEATSLDPMGNVLHGAATYYDENRRLRAQGQYDQGLKTGTWSRFDERGRELSGKVYYGEDWDAMQVRVGVATLSRTRAAEQIALGE